MSQVLNKTSIAIIDILNGRFKTFAKDKAEFADEAIRRKFIELLPERQPNGKFNYRKLMKALPQVFEILEEVLNVTIPSAWATSPFYKEYVETKNLALGDQNKFLVKDASWLSVNKFSGNTWDTDRERLISGKEFSIPTEWFYVRAFDDIERFITGAITIEELVRQIQEAFDRQTDTQIASAFNGANTKLPSDFNITGALTKEEVINLTQLVKKAALRNIKIAGTSLALSKLQELAPMEYSEAMKNEIYTTGRLGRWMGIPTIEIPQAFEAGTYNWEVDDGVLFVLPDGIKPIKAVFEGDTRSQELDYQDTHDQTVDYQIQTKMGFGVVFDTLFGKYTIV
jgi:hypothetical protein